MGPIREQLIEETSILIKEDALSTKFDIALKCLCKEYRNLSIEVEILDYLVSEQKHGVSLKKETIINLWLDSEKFEFNIYGFSFIVFLQDLRKIEIHNILRNLFLGEYKIVNYKSLKGTTIYNEIIWNDVLLDKFNIKEKVAFFKRKINEHEVNNGMKLTVM
ncbi:hypothetical protein J4E06_11170 [Muricauda sp. NFXS6]|uniref:hypothetical protein n=1 Tax=Allomuricauda sp. NFXS6 TaxID=2819094 RepID=UPI0032DF63A2